MNNISDESERLVIAYLGKPVGLKGYIKLHPQSDFTSQFKAGISFFTSSETLTIESFDENRMLAKFIGYNTPEKVSILSTKELFSTISDSRKNCKLKKDEYFWFDIISCNVVENGELLGTVSEIERYTGQDYLEIATTESLVLQKLPKSFLLPYLERYIIDVDLKLKTINVKNAKDILENS